MDREAMEIWRALGSNTHYKLANIFWRMGIFLSFICRIDFRGVNKHVLHIYLVFPKDIC